jgi:Raf kinase inhibitor-like YbhB/YbcL family protein
MEPAMRLVTPLLVPLLVIAALPRVPEAPVALTLRSSAFAAGAAIPAQYTCDGTDASPPLAWSGAPAGTASYVLIVHDPDAPDPEAPRRDWVHWVLYDIPAGTAGLEAGSDPSHLPAGTRAGTASSKRTTWSGPCPPVGRHRYFHKLYALDTVLGERGRPTASELQALMRGHILAQTELIGTYQRAARQ